MVDTDKLQRDVLVEAGKAKVKDALIGDDDTEEGQKKRTKLKLTIAGVVGVGLLGVVGLVWLWSILQWVALAGGVLLVGGVGFAIAKPKLQAKLNAKKEEREAQRLLEEAETQKVAAAQKAAVAKEKKAQDLEDQLAALKNKV